MGTYRYRCMECGQDVDESRDEWHTPPMKFKAMCGRCAKAITLEFFGVRSLADPMCRDCETEGTPSKAERRLSGGTGVCDRHYRKRMGMPAAISTRRPTCVPCQQQGKHVPSTLNINGMNMCAEHAGAAAIENREPDVFEEEPKIEKKERKKMALDIDWAKVQQERNGGASTTELAEKHGCSVPTICGHTKPASRNGKMPRKAGRLESIAENGGGKNVRSSGSIANAIEHMKEKRDKLTQAIELLEGIDA